MSERFMKHEIVEVDDGIIAGWSISRKIVLPYRRPGSSQDVGIEVRGIGLEHA